MNENEFHSQDDTTQKKRWVLLEHLPTILTPRILLLVFVYSMAFTLLLIGLKMYRLEQQTLDLMDKSETIQSSVDTSKKNDAPIYPLEDDKEIQKNIAHNVIRFHVIANSNNPKDQVIKLQVRDKIIGALQSSLKNVKSITQARSIIEGKESIIQATAMKEIQESGFNYGVKVSLNTRYFPVKQYGDLSFPPGKYQALCVEIGKAEGRNWWCVLFPSLCFVDETTANVPEQSKDKLKNNLSAQEYNSLNTPMSQDGANTNQKKKSSKKPEAHFALWDWITGK